MKILRWLAFNIAFVVCLFYALEMKVPGAQNVSIFAIWYLCILSLLALVPDVKVLKNDILNSITFYPRWNIVNQILDYLILVALIWYGWFWMGGAYLVYMISHQSLILKIKKAVEDNELQKP